MTVVFKADTARVLAEGAAPADAAAFEGNLVEVFFVGSTYRHYVAVGQEMLLVDDQRRAAGPGVRVAVPWRQIQAYPGTPAVRGESEAARSGR